MLPFFVTFDTQNNKVLKPPWLYSQYEKLAVKPLYNAILYHPITLDVCTGVIVCCLLNSLNNFCIACYFIQDTLISCVFG